MHRFDTVTLFLLAAFGVWQLLIAYRWVGKPPGADEKYDTWYRQWGGRLKLLGWWWVALTTLCLIGALFW
jgi:hypothetical protein